MRTRKGTGYYKVPSLKGAWYRGPFQHAGAVQTLDEWFDPARLERVPGHPFGLTLTPADRRALVAFIKTLCSGQLPFSCRAIREIRRRVSTDPSRP